MSISLSRIFSKRDVRATSRGRWQRLSTVVARLLSIAATLFLAPMIVQAQQRVLTGVLSGTVGLAVEAPRGDFATNVGKGFGVNASALVRIDPKAIINARADFSFVGYASSTRRIPLAGSGSLVKLDLRTSSSIISVVGGPQLLGTRGVFTPYVSALGGFSYFFTETSVEGSDNTNSPFASTNNSGDASLAYGGAVGAYVQVYKRPTREFRIEFGAKYLRHDNVQYLNDQRVEAAYQNNRDPVPLRGRADFVTYHVGFNAVLF
ncbi:MAG: hypothetical protein ABJB66_12975 [Gemmatimonadaceae bacterium]